VTYPRRRSFFEPLAGARAPAVFKSETAMPLMQRLNLQGLRDGDADQTVKIELDDSLPNASSRCSLDVVTTVIGWLGWSVCFSLIARRR